MDLVIKETDEANYEYLYMNFMIRSYTYFRGCGARLKEDDLFNKLFIKMKLALKLPEMAMYIPDYVQVYFEVLYRNSQFPHIPAEKLRYTAKDLSEFDELI